MRGLLSLELYHFLMATYEVQVKYTDGELRAEMDCPLCKEHWIFPFTAREIFGKPSPSPSEIVVLHLYGCGPETRLCPRFDPGKPFAVENSDARTAIVRI